MKPTVTEADKQNPSNLFEGMTSIRAVIQTVEDGTSDRRILRILCDENRRKARGGELSYLTAMSYKLGYTLSYVPEADIDALALGTSHGGLLMETTSRTIPRLSAESIERAFPEKEKRFFAMLEGIEDPYNFGYAVRSLYAAGISGLILSERNWMSAAGVVCRASAGASERCHVYVSDTDNTVAVMRSLGIRIISCDMANSKPMWDADLSLPLLLCVGGEKRGLTRPLLDASDEIIRLSYGRDFPAALSAASAATIAGFEVLRQSVSRSSASTRVQR